MNSKQETAQIPKEKRALRDFSHKYNNILTLVTNRAELAFLLDERKEMKTALEEILVSSLELEERMQALRSLFLDVEEEGASSSSGENKESE